MRDYEGALAEVKMAEPKLPNNASLFLTKASIERRQGRWEESTRNFQRAIELDPRNAWLRYQIGDSYAALRRYAEQESMLDRAVTIEPNSVGMKLKLAGVEFDWKADARPLHQWIDSIRAMNPAAVTSVVTNYRLSCALIERDAAAAKDALIGLGEDTFEDEVVHFPAPFMEGVIARMTNDEHKARLAFTAARAEQKKIVEAQPGYGPPLCVLGLIDAALGRKEEALQEGRRAVELLPVQKDAINGPDMIKYLAMIAAWVGDNDLACEQLAVAISRPGFLSYGELKLMPHWDPLRGDPRFEKIVASLAPKETVSK